MKRASRAWLVACITILIACTTPLERGDAARAREDWDDAVASYEEALRGAREPQEIEAIKARLSEARDRAAGVQLVLAERSEALRDQGGALMHLERAYQLRPTDDVKQKLQRAQVAEGEAKLRTGRLAFEQGHFGEAIESLERAEALAPSPESAELLVKARAEDQRLRAIEFNRCVTEGKQAVERRDWAGACAAFDRARQVFPRDDAAREASFAKLMAEGESYAARGDARSCGRACALFQQARGYGIDVAHVESRIAATEVVDLVITVHGAVVLPTKPVSGLPWDGVGGGKDAARLAEALALLTAVDPVTTGAASVLGSLFSKGSAAPDCFATVTVDRRSFGGEATFDQDDFLPQWDVRVVLPYVTRTDQRVVTIAVRDRDISEHDNVGAVHLTVAELVDRAARGRLHFYDEHGKLSADGILELDVSVERRPAGTTR